MLIRSNFTGTINNTGQSTLKEQMTGGYYGNSLWRNLAGSYLTLKDESAYLTGTTSATLVNESGAEVKKAGAGVSSIEWDIVNGGNIRIESGGLSISGDVSGTGSIQADANTSLHIYSNEFQIHTLTLDPTANLDFRGSRLEVTNFNGNFAQQSGTYSPGASPAISTLDGNYSMTNGSIFEVELAGSIPGQFDQLTVTGNVDLVHGQLSVALLNGFTVNNGQHFDFMIVDGILNGTFLNLAEGALVGNFGTDVFITYRAGDGNDIALYTAPVPVPPAFWLMTSSLLGLVSLSRRKRA
ncbi:hypothetical protein A1507_22025 [Methylomonas koyamae]|uniref:PEP-CTERM protein-sorting domain-containing protein n=1 Tax=Methylomonas koyamae TaxID=702114 RepID=A0A177MX12_9GAMM|nr:hypothetical protein A1507_22025 [Methylomonas koyamae]